MEHAQEQEFLFEYGLPAGRSMFTLKELAGWWKISVDQLYLLAEAGEFNVPGIAPINFALHPKESRATRRIPRAGIVAFLKRRQQQ